MNEHGEHNTVFPCMSESRSDVHMMIKTLFFVSQVEGNFYVNEPLEKLMFEELRNACRGGGQQRFTSSSSLTCWIRLRWFLLCLSCISGVGGFLPAMKQIGNVAALPGIVHVSIMITRSLQTLREVSLCKHADGVIPQRSIGLPDVHSGYGFAIGNMAAFDMNDPDAVVSPGTFLISARTDYERVQHPHMMGPRHHDWHRCCLSSFRINIWSLSVSLLSCCIYFCKFKVCLLSRICLWSCDASLCFCVIALCCFASLCRHLVFVSVTSPAEPQLIQWSVVLWCWF